MVFWIPVILVDAPNNLRQNWLVEYDYVSKGKLVAIVDDEDDIVELFRDALGSINNTTIFTFTDPVITLEQFIIKERKLS